MGLIKILVILIGILSHGAACAFEVTQELQDQAINRDFQILEDTSGKLTITDILAPNNNLVFESVLSRDLNFGITNSAFWGRFKFTNSSARPIDLVLVNQYAATDRIELYYKTHDGSYKVSRSGDRYTNENKNIQYRLPSIKFTVPPGEHQFYFRQQTKGITQIDFKIWAIENFYNMRSSENIFISCLLGFLIVMILYNLFLAVTLKDMTYTIYVFYIASSLINNAAYIGFLQEILPDSVWLANDGFMHAAGLTAITAALFGIYFLELKKRFPIAFWWGIATIALGTLQSFIIPFNYGLGAKIAILSAFSASTFSLISSLILSIKRFRPAYWYTFAWSCLVIGTIVRVAALYGILPLTFLTSWGQFIGTALEVVLLSIALGDKTHILQQQSKESIRSLNEDLIHQNREINILNSTLEQKVREKVQSIRSILESIELGIFTIGSDHKIAPEYSEFMTNLFPQKKIAGQSLEQLLFTKENISSEKLSQTISAIDFSLGEDEIVFEANRENLVKTLDIEVENDIHHWELDWNAIVTESTTERLLVSIKDVTSVQKLRAKAKDQEKELEYISEIINIDEIKVQSFFNSCRSFMKENSRLLKKTHEYDSEVLKILFINAHTMKGAARALHLEHLSEIIHEWEQYLANVRAKKESWSKEVASDFHNRSYDELKMYEKINYERLGRQRSKQSTIVLDREQAESLLLFFDRHTELANDSTPVTIYRAIHTQLFIPIKAAIYDVSYSLQSLSRDLQKPEPELRVTGAEVSLSKSSQEVLHNCLVHLFRNSMDHGIENTSERLQYDKSECGHIDINISIEENNLIIDYHDDGRGLDLTSIAELSKIRNLISREKKYSDDEIAMLIFESGFSTTKTVSQISGRGVGMDAVKQYLNEIDSSISINLLDSSTTHPLLHERGYRPFSFKIQIPTPHFIDSNSNFYGKAA